MFRLSRKTEYAIQALLYLHQVQEVDKNQESSASARQISEETKIPLDLLAKILQKLNRLHIVSSEKGLKGGYCLVKPLHSLSLATIINHFESDPRVVPCITPTQEQGSESSAFHCDSSGLCTIEEGMHRLNTHLMSLFQSITLKQLFIDKTATNHVTIEGV